MAVGEIGEAGFPTQAQSNCVYFDDKTVYSVRVTLEGIETENIRIYIGTSATITGTIAWQNNITHAQEVTLANPNKALFYIVVGVAPSTITKLKIEYTN